MTLLASQDVPEARDLMTLENGHELEAAKTPDAALYIASITEELARLAKSHQLDALAYILDMARLEADQVSKQWAGPAGRGSHGIDCGSHGID